MDKSIASPNIGPPAPSNKTMFSHRHDWMTISLIAVLSVTFIVTLFTNIGLLLMMSKLGLSSSSHIFDMLRDTNHLTIHQDIHLDKVFASNKVKGINKIYGNADFSTSPSNNLGNNLGAGISIVDDQLIMQGKRLTMTNDSSKKVIDLLNLEKLNSVTMSTSKMSLSSPNGIRQVKMIRPPTYSDLKLESNTSLTLSGNLGLEIFANKSELNSNGLKFHSKDSEIIFYSKEGVKLPLIPSNSHRIDHWLSKSSTETTSHLDLHQVCICRNGRMFKIRKLDNIESCSDAKFPVSANPCL